jgi:hypothetical protein
MASSALTPLEGYHKGGNELLSHVVQVTGNEIWVSFVDVKTIQQSKQSMHTYSPDK